MVDIPHMSMSQVKTVPIPGDEPQQTVGKQPSLKQQATRHATQPINHFLSF